MRQVREQEVELEHAACLLLTLVFPPLKHSCSAAHLLAAFRSTQKIRAKYRPAAVAVHFHGDVLRTH